MLASPRPLPSPEPTRRALPRRRALTLALALIASLPAPAAAVGAWTRPIGNVYAKLAYGAATAADQYTFDGRRKPYADNVDGAAFFDRSVYAYAEGGIIDGLTGIVGLAWKRVYVVDEAFRYERTRLGDLRLGVRHDLGRWLALPDGLTWAVNAWVEAPTGYVRNTIPAPGAGNVDLALTVDVGIGRSAFYAQAGLGARVRTGWYGLSGAVACSPGVHRGCTPAETPDLGDELLARVEIGATPFDWLIVQLLADATVSFEEPAIGFSVSQPTPTHRRLIKTGAGLMLRPWRFIALEAQVFATPWGQNAVDSIDLFLGLSTELDLMAR